MGCEALCRRGVAVRAEPEDEVWAGQPAGDVRRLSDEANRWLVADGELRAMLNGVAGANLIRRQRIALIAGQAFNIGTQLTRDPANAVLVPHLEEVKRLKEEVTLRLSCS
jgi:hypothetical protein